MEILRTASLPAWSQAGDGSIPSTEKCRVRVLGRSPRAENIARDLRRSASGRYLLTIVGQIRRNEDENSARLPGAIMPLIFHWREGPYMFVPEKNVPVVMISSTARDLPNHRDQVMEACLRQSMFPKMMNFLPANDDTAITASLAMVDEADLYVGVFALRYGYIPSGHSISITEMEYDRAVQRGIPRLIFLMHDDHPVKAADVETGDGATLLKKLKDRLQTDRSEEHTSELQSP